MAFARWGKESDVYVFLDAGSLDFKCCACTQTEVSKTGFHDDFDCERITEMLEHLAEHRAAGDSVPDEAFEALKDFQKKEGDDQRQEKRKRQRREAIL